MTIEHRDHNIGEEPTPKQIAYDYLKDWIKFAKLKPGATLRERNLAEQFGISRTPLREIFQRLASLCATDAEIEELGEIVNNMRGARNQKDKKVIIQLDQFFHHAMRKAACNDVMKEILENLHNVCLRFWYVNEKLGDEYEVVDELSGVMTALENRNTKRAADRIGEHVSSFFLLDDEDATRTLQNLPAIRPQAAKGDNKK